MEQDDKESSVRLEGGMGQEGREYATVPASSSAGWIATSELAELKASPSRRKNTPPPFIPPKSPRRYNSNSSSGPSTPVSPATSIPRDSKTGLTPAVMYLVNRPSYVSTATNDSSVTDEADFYTPPPAPPTKDKIAPSPLRAVSHAESSYFPPEASTSKIPPSPAVSTGSNRSGTNQKNRTSLVPMRRQSRIPDVPLSSSPASQQTYLKSHARQLSPSLSSGFTDPFKASSRPGSRASFREDTPTKLHIDTSSSFPRIQRTISRASRHSDLGLTNTTSTSPISRSPETSPRLYDQRGLPASPRSPIKISLDDDSGSLRSTGSGGSRSRVKRIHQDQLSVHSNDASSVRSGNSQGSASRKRQSQNQPQATSLGPIDLGDDNASNDDIERQFLAAIERRRDSQLEDGSNVMTLSMPSAVRSYDSIVSRRQTGRQGSADISEDPLAASSLRRGSGESQRGTIDRTIWRGSRLEGERSSLHFSSSEDGGLETRRGSAVPPSGLTAVSESSSSPNFEQQASEHNETGTSNDFAEHLTSSLLTVSAGKRPVSPSLKKKNRFSVPSDVGKTLVENFTNRWELNAPTDSEMSEQDDLGNEVAQSPYSWSSYADPIEQAGEHARGDGDAEEGDSRDVQIAASRRMGRLFGSVGSAGTAYSYAMDDLETPRGSVSRQGQEATYSMYSRASTMPEVYPYTAGMPPLPEADLPSRDPLDGIDPVQRHSHAYSFGSEASTGSLADEEDVTAGPDGFVSNVTRRSYSTTSYTSAHSTTSSANMVDNFATPDMSPSGFDLGATSPLSALTKGTVASRPMLQHLRTVSSDKDLPTLPALETPNSGMFDPAASFSDLSLQSSRGGQTQSESEASSAASTPGRTAAEKAMQKRAKTIEELVETERTFAQDMLVTRDIWLARAKGKELGEIMASLRTASWTPPHSPFVGGGNGYDSPSAADSPMTGSIPGFAGSQPHTVISSSAMAPSASKSSMKGFVNPFALSSNLASIGKGRPSSFASNASKGESGDRPPQARRIPSYSSSNRQSIGSAAALGTSHSLSQSLPASGLRATTGNRASGTSTARLGSVGRTGSQASLEAAGHGRSVSYSAGTTFMAAMTSSDLKTIFGNLDDIAGFSETFLQVLEASAASIDEEGEKMQDDKYGEAFLSILPRMEQVYSVYCSRFGTALSRYEEIADQLTNYTSECKELSHGLTNAWDLPSLLIKPVQRCLKYPLFLQSLLQLTPETHPDRPSLVEANTRVLKVAETINELKRRQELVGRIVKPRVRSDSYASGSARKGSSGSYRVRTASGDGISSEKGSFSHSVSKKFRRSGNKMKAALALRTDSMSNNDAAFDALVQIMEVKYAAVQAFIANAKGWSKASRATLVALLQLCFAWRQVYAPISEDEETSRSARTIDYFAANVVKRCLEGPWADVDKEIRKTLAPKVAELLELFKNPQAVIAKRNTKLADGSYSATGKPDRASKDAYAAYQSLNGQLLAELPSFLHAVETYFTALVGHLVALQTAFHRIMHELWTEYVQLCCTQLAPPASSGENRPRDINSMIAAWWKLHHPIVVRFDSFGILSTDAVLYELEKTRHSGLPATLRRRKSSLSNSTPIFERRPSILRRKTRDSVEPTLERRPSKASSIASIGISEFPPPIPRKHSSGRIGLQEEAVNRASMVSASSGLSAGSFAFSTRTGSSVTSPSTPNLDTLPPLYTAACNAGHRSSSKTQPIGHKGYPHLQAQPGELFDILDETQNEGYALVRRENNTEIGWLPLAVIRRLE